jgi:ABC-type phosphate/phosphonate transport system substrate-binding protein
MIASLPMYYFEEIADATHGLWAALKQKINCPSSLSRIDDHKAAWRRDDLIFSQTCGYPFTHEFRGVLTYVATPNYAADGCDGPNYRSIILAREAKPLDAFQGCKAAINNDDSMSGMLAMRLVLPNHRPIYSGGHLASMEAVQSRRADICAIDCVTLALVRRYRPAACEGLIEVGRSPCVPGLPYVTRAGDVTKLRAALFEVCGDPSNRELLNALLLKDVTVMPQSSYDLILTLEKGLEAQSRR